MPESTLAPQPWAKYKEMSRVRWSNCSGRRCDRERFPEAAGTEGGPENLAGVQNPMALSSPPLSSSHMWVASLGRDAFREVVVRTTVDVEQSDAVGWCFAW